MNLTDLLTQATMLSAPHDETALAPLRARLFGRLRASGWMPAGAPRGTALSPATSDEALLTAFLQGDAATFDILFNRHAPRLNGCARRCLQPADAEEVVQEVLIILFEKANEVLDHKPVNIAGYLFGTLRNKIQHILVKRAREIPTDTGEPTDPSPEDDGLTALLKREETTRLTDLLARTCDPLEQDVILHDLKGLEGAEIAAALNITPGYVRVLRHRALTKLRRALDKTEEGSPT